MFFLSVLTTVLQVFFPFLRVLQIVFFVVLGVDVDVDDFVVVVVVGGCCVARRRVPKLLDAGARVAVISPEVHSRLAGLAEAGAITWHARSFEPTDLDGAWYVLALTDAPAANAAIVAEAEARHTYCVRADRADDGSAWTPATGDTAGVTVAAITSHDPLRARRVRDRFLEIVNEESL